MKAALVCPTIGQTRRGYERFMTELHQLIRDEVDVTLFKGGGTSIGDEVVVPHVTRTGRAARLCGNRLKFLRYRLEFASFAHAMRPLLVRGGFDLVHFIDPPLARPLARLRARNRLGYRLLYTQAGPDPDDAWRFADRVHCLTPEACDALTHAGLAADRIEMLPVGLHAARGRPSATRAELRQRSGLSTEAFVVLAVTTLNRRHKRVDHLIEEVAAAGPGVCLWIDAGLQPDGDPALIELARQRLGDRFRHTHVPTGQVDDLYRLADVLVSAAVEETFGMAIVEAMSCGLPVVTHDSPHFRWLVGAGGHLVDMGKRGRLASLLADFRSGRVPLAPRDAPAGVLQRFGWDVLRPHYLAMYRTAAGATE